MSLHREGRDGRRLDSDRVGFGEHAERVSYRDDRYQHCSKCSFICNLDRDISSNDGDRAGDGITYSSVATNTGLGWGNDEWGSGYWSGSIYKTEPVVGSGCPLCGSLMI